MDQRETGIIEAAIRLFTRYGVKRTTMADIAVEAGIARQTLYNVYANKDEVLRGTIRYLTDTGIAAVHADWAKAEGLEARLDAVFRTMVLEPYELLKSLPDADDVVSGFNAAGQDELARGREEYRKLIAELLAPHEKAIRAAGLEAAQLSDFVQRAAHGFKYDARDMAHLRQMLQSLKVLVLRLVAGG